MSNQSFKPREVDSLLPIVLYYQSITDNAMTLWFCRLYFSNVEEYASILHVMYVC